MLFNFFLVVQTSILTISGPVQNDGSGQLSERTKRIVQDEVSLKRAGKIKKQAESEKIKLEDSYFMDGDGNWVDSSYDYYYDEKWLNYNCYAFAMRRYDIAPDYYPYLEYYYYGDDTNGLRCYDPGQISLLPDPGHYPSVREQAEAVVSDFNILGYHNVSTFRFNGFLPALGADEELIAVRVSEPPDYYDYHFMRFDKGERVWYHKPSHGSVLKYKYPLCGWRSWTDEFPSNTPATVTYSSDIWLIKYTPVILRPSIGVDLNESLYIDNVGDKVFRLDIATAGHLDLTFQNVNGFTAVLYTDEWDAVDASTYNPISADVSAGRYYLVMKNYRYSDYVDLTVSLGGLESSSSVERDDNMFVITEGEGLIIGRVVGESSVEMTLEPIAFPNEDDALRLGGNGI